MYYEKDQMNDMYQDLKEFATSKAGTTGKKEDSMITKFALKSQPFQVMIVT